VFRAGKNNSRYRLMVKLLLKFETRMMQGELPSVLTFTYDLLSNLVLSSIAYAIVCIDGRIKYITKEVLISKHDCL
jgi:hypothetical protein